MPTYMEKLSVKNLLKRPGNSTEHEEFLCQRLFFQKFMYGSSQAEKVYASLLVKTLMNRNFKKSSTENKWLMLLIAMHSPFPVVDVDEFIFS